MKEKLIFCIAIILIISLYFYGASNSPNNNKNRNTQESGIKFEETLSSNNKEQKPQKQNFQNRNIQNPQPVKTAGNTQVNNYGISSTQLNNNSVSREEIERRERAVFEDLKRQQYNKQRNRTAAGSYNRNYTNNTGIDGYLLGNMAIDKPPTGEQMQEGSTQTREYYIQQNLAKGDRVIPINQLTALSYKSRQEVFNERKKYVSESLFAYPNYEPDKKTLGQIEDGKPWISAKFCQKQGMSLVDGNSEETRFLNNPSILVGIDWPYSFTADDKGICDNNEASILPSNARYIKNENLIEVTYKSLPFVNDKESPYTLKGLNARDFGYEYARFDNNKSKNVFMINFNCIASEVIQFKDFIHTGESCGVPGGCNNGSPHQPKLEFYYPDPSLETVMYIKLWRKMPKDYMQPADINEKIIILPEK